ncbi:MAG: leucine-rich repeat domain-containing protein, partial [Bacteroidota bacterium]
PAFIRDMKNLRKIDLRGNQLRKLPPEILQLPSLERLDLRWNPLEDIPSGLELLQERGCLVYL